jgi:hypothetical protein
MIVSASAGSKLESSGGEGWEDWPLSSRLDIDTASRVMDVVVVVVDMIADLALLWHFHKPAIWTLGQSFKPLQPLQDLTTEGLEHIIGEYYI